ncbi:MAG: hypothetical protein WCD89_12730 [Anaerocolumna sp.]
MKNKDLQASYIERLNTMLPTMDFKKLNQSCNSAEDDYVKEILLRIKSSGSELGTLLLAGLINDIFSNIPEIQF